MRQTHIKKIAHFTVIGDYGIFSLHSSKDFRNCSFTDLGNVNLAKYKIGKPNEQSASASVEYLSKAIELLKSNKVSALVTAPVCKEAISLRGQKFEGHTEFLAGHFNIKKFGMMFVARDLKTVVVTRHIAIQKVNTKMTAGSIFDTIDVTAAALKNYFKIKKPRIAVCGLNPHAGENGTIGTEEITKIIPAINKAKKGGLAIFGPLAADTVFVPKNFQKYDCIVAMYHDQGIIPIKTLYFDKVVNLTIGLPFVRTSPAHGTAFDIAGKNIADSSSMREAIKLAIRLAPYGTGRK